MPTLRSSRVLGPWPIQTVRQPTPKSTATSCRYDDSGSPGDLALTNNIQGDTDIVSAPQLEPETLPSIGNDSDPDYDTDTSSLASSSRSDDATGAPQAASPWVWSLFRLGNVILFLITSILGCILCGTIMQGFVVETLYETAPLQLHEPLHDLALALAEPIPYFDKFDWQTFVHSDESSIVDAALEICRCPLRWAWLSLRQDRAADDLWDLPLWQEEEPFSLEVEFLKNRAFPGIAWDWDRVGEQCVNLEVLSHQWGTRSTYVPQLRNLLSKSHKFRDMGEYRTRLREDAQHQLEALLNALALELAFIPLNHSSSMPPSLADKNTEKQMIMMRYLARLDALDLSSARVGDLSAPGTSALYESLQGPGEKLRRDHEVHDELPRHKRHRPRNPRAHDYRDPRDETIVFHNHSLSKVLKLIHHLEGGAAFLRRLRSEVRGLTSILQDTCHLDENGKARDTHNCSKLPMLDRFFCDQSSMPKKVVCSWDCLPRFWQGTNEWREYDRNFSLSHDFLAMAPRVLWVRRTSREFGAHWPSFMDSLDLEATKLDAHAAKLAAILQKLDEMRKILRATLDEYAPASMRGNINSPSRWGFKKNTGHSAFRFAIQDGVFHPDFGVMFPNNLSTFYPWNRNGHKSVWHLTSAPLCAPDPSSASSSTLRPSLDYWTLDELTSGVHGLANVDSSLQLSARTMNSQDAWQRCMSYLEKYDANTSNIPQLWDDLKSLEHMSRNMSISHRDGRPDPVENDNKSLALAPGTPIRHCHTEEWLDMVLSSPDSHRGAQRPRNNLMSVWQLFSSLYPIHFFARMRLAGGGIQDLLWSLLPVRRAWSVQIAPLARQLVALTDASFIVYDARIKGIFTE